jgi:hypothetical protein
LARHFRLAHWAVSVPIVTSPAARTVIELSRCSSCRHGEHHRPAL